MNRHIHMTPQRQSVYDIVQRATDHPTAADVMERLRKDGHKVAYATVYNSLRYLIELGVIQELQIGSGSARYDARLDAHQHVLCVHCGRVDEVLKLEPSDYSYVIERETGYRIEHLDVLAKGICPNCASKSSITTD